jgi:SEC-C motif
MATTFRHRLDELKIGEVLRKYPGLRLAPSRDESVRLVGDLPFRVQGPEEDPIEDTYAVELLLPPGFPPSLPSAWETGGRIPGDHHKMTDESLCLGAPTAQRLAMRTSPTALGFIEKLVIPYLFGFSFRCVHGRPPYGELSHGEQGIREYIAQLFGSPVSPDVKKFLLLASMRRRQANKLPCPCGSGRRLGRCHHRKVNSVRELYDRWFFKAEYERVSDKDAGVKGPIAEALL